MNKPRSGDLNRLAGSFLLAVVLHALLFLLQINGIWGARGGSLEYTLIHPRVIELEPAQTVAPKAEAKVTPAENPPAPPKPPAPEKPPARPTEEAVAQLREVHQEQPAARETKAEQEEPVTTRPEEPDPATDATESGEVQAVQAPAEPALPPLGTAGGMVLFAPKISYPKDEQHLALEAVVQLELYITVEGTLLKDPIIVNSSGYAAFEEHCLKMFTNPNFTKVWKFKPAPQPYKILFEVRFEKDEVEADFIGEAVYLSPAEGGVINETKAQ